MNKLVSLVRILNGAGSLSTLVDRLWTTEDEHHEHQATILGLCTRGNNDCSDRDLECGDHFEEIGFPVQIIAERAESWAFEVPEVAETVQSLDVF
jgi:hypothetical protein